jgi:hypothetical protein
MRFIKKICAVAIILSFISVNMPGTVFAGDEDLYSESSHITENVPEMIVQPEVDIPMEQVSTESKGSKKWIYYLLGGALIAGGAAIGLGGSSAGSEPEPPKTGTIVISGPAP